MKVVGEREGLLSAAQLASAALPARPVKPILANVKAVAESDRCTILATDLELGIRLEVREVQVEESGAAIIPAARLLAILRESTADTLTIEADTQACHIRGQYGEFEMAGEDPADFPDVPVFSEERYHELAGGTLKELIRRTLFAAAAENPRYAMTGVLWELEGSTARLVATDGRRLAVAEGTAEAHGGHDTKGRTHVVPTKAMQLLERNLQDPDEKVRVSLRPNEVLFQTAQAMIYSRLVEGRYPPYREVFPKKPTVKVPLVVGPFQAAVRQAAIMTDEESKKVTCTFAPRQLTLVARGAATGRSKIELPLDYDGKEVVINFDPRFLTDMLRVLDADAALTLELTDGNSPALFRHGEQYSYIVMPLS